MPALSRCAAPQVPTGCSCSRCVTSRAPVPTSRHEACSGPQTTSLRGPVSHLCLTPGTETSRQALHTFSMRPGLCGPAATKLLKHRRLWAPVAHGGPGVGSAWEDDGSPPCGQSCSHGSRMGCLLCVHVRVAGGHPKAHTNASHIPAPRWEHLH